jgi:L-threonylcarbamoyladenylate synthase
VVTTLAVDPRDPGSAAIEAAVRVLRREGIVAIPTETFYGLAVDARSGAACERLHVLKGRPAEKAFPCIVSGIPQLEAVALRLNESAVCLAKKFWPGPLTLIVEAGPGFAASSPDGSLAVRASGLRLARDLAESLGAPLTATSANRSGAKAATSADEGVRARSGVDLILRGRCPGTPPRLSMSGSPAPARGQEVLSRVNALTCAHRKLE